MKFHYANILLCSLTLNILVTSLHLNNPKNAYKISHTSTEKTTKSHRTLCECDIYKSIYDNDPEMQKVMENFSKQTQQRFRENDETFHEKRQKCKEKCDKDIQKIILKDKIEKELAEKFSTLNSNITNEDIPTCICKKSVDDKIEKTCLKYGGVLGGGAVPGLGLIGPQNVYILANAATIQAFISKTTDGLNGVIGISNLFEKKIENFVTSATYDQPTSIVTTILSEKEKLCACPTMKKKILCSGVLQGDIAKSIPNQLEQAVQEGVSFAKDTWTTTTAPTAFWSNPIILSAIAIAVIVLVMIIIYLILHYKRKQKMKKKLQYIKLLKE
ncbi:rifin [Plasmodium sp. gorilla clade G1]|nr:rifin [Plasmodium sp. gorilla clade G1]